MTGRTVFTGPVKKDNGEMTTITPKGRWLRIGRRSRRGGMPFLLLGGASLLFLSLTIDAFAQSTVGTVIQSDGRLVPTAQGILTPHLTTGPFGTSVAGGYLAPTTNDEASRFSNGVVLTPSGEFVGIDNNLNSSLFGSYWEQRPEGIQENQPLSEQDILLYLRAQRNRATAAQEEMTPTPQQVSATPMDPLPYRQPTGREDVASAPVSSPEPPVSSASTGTPEVTEIPQRSPRPSLPPEQIWMRGRAPLPSGEVGGRPELPETALRGMGQGVDQAGNLGVVGDLSNPMNAGQPALTDGGGRFIGGPIPEDYSSNESRPLPSEALARVRQRQERREEAAFQEYLETMVLQSPLVSPLSPIQVSLSGSKVTIRGIVPNDAARLEAARILLTDPRVQTVDNQLAVLPQDAMETPPAPFDPSLPRNNQPE